MGTAALAAGWNASQRRKFGKWALAPTGSAGSPQIDGGDGGPIGLKVEIYLGDLGWIDISSSVYYRNRVRIQRGRSNETSQTPPQTCALTLNNRGGTFTPRNAAGPYFKLIGRNTPIRVSRFNNGIQRFRYAGEVPSWPTTSDISGRDVYEQVNAAGPLRRLVQGNAPLRSPMFRAYTRGVTSSLVTAYWPCEDAVNSTSIASGLSGGVPMALGGSPTFSANTSFACSAPLPTLNKSTWTAPLPLTAGSTGNVLRMLLDVPATGDTDFGTVARMFTTGTVARAELQYSQSFGGSLQLSGFDAFGNTLFSTGYGFQNLSGQQIRLSVELLQSGSNITAALVALIPGQRAFAFSNSIAGTIGTATSIVVNPNATQVGTAIGHISYAPTWDSLYNLAGPLNAWINEPPDAAQANDISYTSSTASAPFASSRFIRLCSEQGINPVVMASPLGYDVDPGPAAPVGMGAQTIDTFTTLIQQIPDVTAGMLFEPRDQVGLAIRTRSSLYNQAAKLTLDHSLHQLSGPLNPVDDDQQVRNDVIVSRINGSSAQVTQTSGTLSTQPPPAGVGDYQTQYQLSLASDALLADAAGWRLHLGTVDEPRYPQLMLNLRHPTFTGNVDMMNAALALDIGDRIVINNPPPELPPDPISLIVQGYSEVLGVYEHDMVINCSPESPYRVALLEDPVLGHADTDGSTLSAPILGSDVTFTVATTNPASPIWTTNPADFPFDVNIGGERITVPGISGGSSPQFFTNVIRNLNGTPLPLGADGTFETGITGWTPTGGTFAASTTQAHSGTTSGLMTTTGTPSQTFVRTPMIPVTPGTAVAATQWVLTASGTPNCLCVIDFFDAGQNYQGSYASPAVNAPGVWTVQQSLTTVPAGVAYAQIGPTVNGSPPAGTAIWVDDVTFTTPPPHPAGTDVRLWQPMILSL